MEQLPNVVEIEDSLVVSCLINDDDEASKILSMVKPEDFYKESNRITMGVFDEVLESKMIPDLATVGVKLSKMKIDGLNAAGLVAIMDEIDRSLNIEAHCKMIRKASQERKRIAKLNEMLKATYQGEDEKYMEFFDELKVIDRDTSDETAMNISDALIECMEEIEDNYNSEGRLCGVPTGFNEYDNLTSGLIDGTLNIIAARPSMGKTSLALSIAKNVAEAGNGVAIFSLEMTRKQLMRRLLSAESGIDSTELRDGLLTPSRLESLTDTASQLSSYPLYIDDCSKLNPREFIQRLSKLIEHHGVKLAIIDYLQIMKPDRNYERNDLEIGGITRALKETANELNIPIIVLAQLNRQLESRAIDNRRPILSDLRGSGEIEQHGDIITFIYRDTVYNDKADDEAAELIIAKNRDGATKTVNVRFLEDTASFVDLKDDGSHLTVVK